MRTLSRSRLGFVFPLALAGVLAAGSASGATILFDNLLANPSFEIGGGLGVCPTSWTCGLNPNNGLSNSYAPTNVEYIAGSDGLPGNKNAPDGSKVGSAPTGEEGSGFIFQTGLGTYLAGNTYTLNLWVGTPLKVPAVPATGALPVGTFRVYFLGNAAGTLGAVDVAPSATPGQWALRQLSFTPTGNQVGQTIGLEIFIDSTPVGGGSGNDHIADFDIAAPVPEPGTIGFIGLGLLGLGALRRKRSAA